MKVFFSCFLIFVLAACNQTGKKQVPENKFNEIEKIVENANWQLIDGHDTSYIYFSRIGNAYINVYRYQISKGDSVNTQMNNIIHQQDSVVWNWGNEKLLLAAVNDTTIEWKKMGAGNAKYIMQKADSLHLAFVFPDGHKVIMKRTLPLSAFLVRQRYDYVHGASYTDSAVIMPRHIKNK
jgi:hypothetical protein